MNSHKSGKSRGKSHAKKETETRNNAATAITLQLPGHETAMPGKVVAGTIEEVAETLNHFLDQDIDYLNLVIDPTSQKTIDDLAILMERLELAER